MTDNLDSGTFKIVSLSQGDPPIGVNYTKPAWQTVSVNGPVQDWTIHKTGDHKYRLSIGGYGHTGVQNGKVTASIYPEHEAEWKITHHVHHNAFTIALAEKPHLGWTVPTNLEGGHGVEIKTITSSHSVPPHFSPRQLFSIKKHH
ncbi:hypothetical protein HD554DRAFT_2140283 [Boletus coccyginus]|nr:hypothetical protein HD554DRAFT_2140283 [Boletus coccyginus]